MKLIAGIDPGVKTGFALWDADKQEFRHITTTTIIGVTHMLTELIVSNSIKEIWFEDSRKRGGRQHNLQGAGSIKRDCSIWQQFCEYYKIKHKEIAPQTLTATIRKFVADKSQTKIDDKTFKKITGWKGRTSQHARDAAMLVYGAR